jgi:ribA/ribD-fused uncharacterized protein
MIDDFNGEYRFLSNFYLHPITYEGIRYPSTEHAYQATKTENVTMRKQIARERSPNIAKHLGRRLLLRSDWEEIKIQVMTDVCSLKFSNPELQLKLLETTPHELIEGNWWGDRYWGMCKGEGKNWLGRILMRLRVHIWQLKCECLSNMLQIVSLETPATDYVTPVESNKIWES